MAPSRSYRIAVAGATTWQRVLTASGSFVERLSGSALTALILARWGVPVSLVSLVGDDAAGERARAVLAAAGVDLTWLTTRPGECTEVASIMLDHAGGETPLELRQGPHLVRGDRLDVYAVFSSDLVVLDLEDFALRRFLVDLPAHTVPTTRLLGTMSGLVAPDEPEHTRVALAHDAIVATEPEFLVLTGARSLDTGIPAFRDAMRISNLRAAALLTSNGTMILTRATQSELDASVRMPLSASARAGLLAGMAFGMVRRWPWEQVVPFATGAATLIDAAQSGPETAPSLERIAALLGVDPATLNP